MDAKAERPPVLASGTATAAASANPALLGTTKRDDGAIQVTRADDALYYYYYYYYYSHGPEDVVSCRNVDLSGGYWYEVTSAATTARADRIGLSHRFSISRR